MGLDGERNLLVKKIRQDTPISRAWLNIWWFTRMSSPKAQQNLFKFGKSACETLNLTQIDNLICFNDLPSVIHVHKWHFKVGSLNLQSTVGWITICSAQNWLVPKYNDKGMDFPQSKSCPCSPNFKRRMTHLNIKNPENNSILHAWKGSQVIQWCSNFDLPVFLDGGFKYYFPRILTIIFLKWVGSTTNKMWV